MSSIHSLYCCGLVTLYIAVQPHALAAAQNNQALTTIQTAAEHHVHTLAPSNAGKIFVTADALDKRLRLRQCAESLQTFLPHSTRLGARITVGVRCNHGTGWTVYVPVTVETEAQVLVLRQALARHAPLHPDSVTIQTRKLSGLGSRYPSDPEQLKQHHLKRALSAGSVLTVDVMEPDLLVRRGQQVTLISTINNIEVRAQGVALTDGAAGGYVRAQNSSSLKVVEGKVDTENVIRVQL